MAMGQKIPVSRKGREKAARKSRREPSLDPYELTAHWTERSVPADPWFPKPGHGRKLAWRGVELCNSFLHRWFNLCDCGAEAALYLYASPLLRCFAGMDSSGAAAPHETTTFRSRHLLEQHGLLGPEVSPALPGSESKFEISWRSPWLYLSLVLLAWLLLL
jgi:IS5 family transposase